MILFDFEQSAEKSILRFSGTFKQEDAEDLKRILLNSLNGTSQLVVELNNELEISSACKDIFLSIYQLLANTGKRLVLTGKTSGEVLDFITKNS